MRASYKASGVWLFLALFAVAGLAWLAVRHADRELRTAFVQRVRQVAEALEVDGLRALEGSAADLDRVPYRRLKEQLVAVRASSRNIRFLYVMGLRPDGQVFFFADSEPVASRDYSPPGQHYAESTAELVQAFQGGPAFVEGPVADRWGVWVSALVPLVDPEGGTVAAVLGMDIDARTWRWDVAARAAAPVGAMAVLLIAVAAVVAAARRVDVRPRPVLRRLLPPLAALVAALTLGAGALLWAQYRQGVDGELSQDMAGVAGDLRLALDQQSRGLELAARLVASDRTLPGLLRERDAARLETDWSPVFETLRRESGLTHFSFMDTNSVCLLRFIKPELRGDVVGRVTAQAALRTGKVASGLELGPLGTFTLRVVCPVWEGGSLVGLVELGKEIEDVLRALSGNRLAVLIRKAHLSRARWEEGMRVLGRAAEWERLPGCVVAYASDGGLPDAFARFADRFVAMMPFSEWPHGWEACGDGRSWRLAALPLQDAGGETSGALLVMRDLTTVRAAFWRLLSLGGAAGAVLLALLLGGVYVLLRRTDSSIRAQQTALVSSEERHRELLQNMPIGVVAHGPDTRILYANPTAAGLLGLTEEQMRGKTALDPSWSFRRTDGSRLPLEEYPVNRALGPGGLPPGSVLGILRPDRPYTTWVECYSYRIAGSAGELQQIVVTFFDVTSRKAAEDARERLEEQLRQAQKMESVGRLAGGVAHDFNNMLGVIIGYAELALAHGATEVPIRHALEEIHKAAGRSADLTRQLLAFGRKQAIAPVVLDLNATLESMLKMLRRLIGESVELVWKPKAGLGSVKVDPSQVDQILANLCVNARDAMGGAGRLVLETDNCTLDGDYCASHADAVPGEYVTLIVSDSGCGMDKEALSHLFEPFYTTKEVGKGTGLGLATVYGIVRQNGGSVSVYSEPGHGTVFRIYLPRHAGGTEPPGGGAGAAGELPRGCETVLLAEDEGSVLAMTALALQRLGYDVLTADTPEEALRLARAHPAPIHLLLTDVIMPRMNGRALSSEVRALRPGIRCLFMSGYAADAIVHHGVLDRDVRFIQKPASLRDLAAKVRSALDAPPA